MHSSIDDINQNPVAVFVVSPFTSLETTLLMNGAGCAVSAESSKYRRWLTSEVHVPLLRDDAMGVTFSSGGGEHGGHLLSALIQFQLTV